VALIVPAYAKLNLTLDVIGRRPNGYHDIDSVMQTISLHDLLLVERTDCRVFEVVGPAIAGENLVLKAARELEGHTGRALPFTIRLFKRIPMGAGLGGGSADAAAFLRAAILLYALKLSHDDLIEIGTAVGQDVPFLLAGGTARATGLGSTISALPPAPSSWRFLVVDPPIEISTRAVYEAFDGSGPSAHRTPALVTALSYPPLSYPPPRPSPARGEGDNPDPARGEGENPVRAEETFVFGNDLEPASRRLFPGLEEAINRLRDVVPGLTMSGTGAALFAVFTDRDGAKAALDAVRKLGYPAWLCRPVPAAA
jgi:4-diphosphocytidyl-2-C-methyl-D-erythritol kinase